MYKEPTYSEAIFNIFLARVLKEKGVIKNISAGKYSNVHNMIVYGDKNIKESWKLDRK
ncbi:MAG: hypothetical protein PHG84_06995 [Endomicrobiaceae bacterium]|nr:hypothetical protein [Endomicrobiaceae bacterium]